MTSLPESPGPSPVLVLLESWWHPLLSADPSVENPPCWLPLAAPHFPGFCAFSLLSLLGGLLFPLREGGFKPSSSQFFSSSHLFPWVP